MSQEDEPEVTCDVISDHLELFQSKRGYRFGLDALLLATDLPELTPSSVVYDLGAAQGPVALSISARRVGDVRVVAVERQEGLARLLERNVAHNARRLGRVDIVRGDVREHRSILTGHDATHVVCNPPYYPESMRRPSANVERAQARHELHGTVADFIDAARYVLSPRGWFKMVLPPWRLGDVFASLAVGDLHLHTLRMVHAEPGADAYLVEIVARRAQRADLRVLPPLVVRGEDGVYTEEVARRIASAATPEPSEERG